MLAVDCAGWKEDAGDCVCHAWSCRCAELTRTMMAAEGDSEAMFGC